MGAHSGNSGGGVSKAVNQTIADLGPTCFCRIGYEQMQGLLEYSEERLEEMMKEYFPKAKDKEGLRKALMALPRGDNLRNLFFLRMEYEDLLRRNITSKIDTRPESRTVRGEGEYDPFGKLKKVKMLAPVPSSTGRSLSDWMKDVD